MHLKNSSNKGGFLVKPRAQKILAVNLPRRVMDEKKSEIRHIFGRSIVVSFFSYYLKHRI